MHAENKNESASGVLIIYTGGTIGSAPSDPLDPSSPQTVVTWERLWEALPELHRLKEQGCIIDCIPFDEPLDSCNVGSREWTKMAEIIAAHYHKYAGFVILHGTDTMAYSASMLSFMLRDLGKPVVFTGAQRSALVDVRNDAIQNFISAILLANPPFSGLPVIPEVVICFGGLILRGNRTIKNDTFGYTAYHTPNLEPIGEIGDRILINERLLRHPPGPERRFHINTRLNTKVVPLFIYPGISAELVRRQLSLPDLRAVVVISYGTGNIPTDPEIIKAFREAREKQGVILAIVSQCRRGPVELGMYEASATLLETGFISAADITTEAAVCKLMNLLGDPDADPADIESDFQITMAGEQSFSQYITRLADTPGHVTHPPDTTEPARFRFHRRSLSGRWEPSRINRAVLRFRGARLTAETSDYAAFRLFINLDTHDTLPEIPPHFSGRFRKWKTEQPGVTVFDITHTIRSYTSPGERISFTLVLDTPGTSFSWSSLELAVFVREIGI